MNDQPTTPDENTDGFHALQAAEHTTEPDPADLPTNDDDTSSEEGTELTRASAGGDHPSNEEERTTPEKVEEEAFLAVGHASKQGDATNADALVSLEAARVNIDPTQRQRGGAIQPGGTRYKSGSELERTMTGEARYVVRFHEDDEKHYDRARTHGDPEGLFETRAEAQEVAAKLRARTGYEDVTVQRVTLPQRILVWDKWSEQRLRVRKFLLSKGCALTGGDRTPATNEAVGGVRNSLHLTTRGDVWADDWIFGNNYDELRRIAAQVRQRFPELLECLVHDAGSGTHLHVAGKAPGHP